VHDYVLSDFPKAETEGLKTLLDAVAEQAPELVSISRAAATATSS